jgi:hypothetical protein
MVRRAATATSHQGDSNCSVVEGGDTVSFVPRGGSVPLSRITCAGRRRGVRRETECRRLQCGVVQ